MYLQIELFQFISFQFSLNSLKQYILYFYNRNTNFDH